MIDIPNIKQGPLSTSCGPYCMKMICDFAGVELDIKEVEELCNFGPEGTLEANLGVGLMKAGVPVIMYHPPDGQHIRTRYLNMSFEKIAASLKMRSIRSTKEIRKLGFQGLSEAVGNGLVTFDVPTQEVIEEELDRGHPWIIAIRPFRWYGSVDEKLLGLVHFVIVQGYGKDYYMINDPSYENGGMYKVTKQHLLYNLYYADKMAICVELSKVKEKECTSTEQR